MKLLSWQKQFENMITAIQKVVAAYGGLQAVAKLAAELNGRREK